MYIFTNPNLQPTAIVFAAFASRGDAVDEYDHAAIDMLLPSVGFLFDGAEPLPKGQRTTRRKPNCW